MISVVTVITTTTLILYAIVSDPVYSPSVRFQDDDGVSWKNLLSTYGLIAFQFDIHPLLLNIQVDMKNRRNINKAVIYAFLCKFSCAAEFYPI